MYGTYSSYSNMYGTYSSYSNTYGTYSSYSNMEVLQHSSSMSFDRTFPLFHLTARTHLNRNVIRFQMVTASYSDTAKKRSNFPDEKRVLAVHATFRHSFI